MPTPLPTFADLRVPKPIVAALAEQGIVDAFPIQAATLPDALAGRDVCGRAPTGSGKTIAFGIPLVLNARNAAPGRPRGLVLVPTRELAAQVSEELRMLAKPRGPRVDTFYGGVPFDRQRKALQRGVDIAVACPGRLADLIRQGNISLSDCQTVVIDEADRMADMGFLPEVRRLLDKCPADRQTLLFSATLDGAVDVLIRNYQHKPARHELPDEERDTNSIHHFWEVDRSRRVSVAADIVRRSGPTVMFCRTKRGADRVAKQLDGHGLTAVAIHGDRTQPQRDRALRAFHRGEAAVLVATDVAARGIHVDGVACVIHFDPPADAKDYVHRSGRTARAGASGVVVNLVAPELRADVAKLQRALDRPTGLAAIDLDALHKASTLGKQSGPRRKARPVGQKAHDGAAHKRPPQTAKAKARTKNRSRSRATRR